MAYQSEIEKLEARFEEKPEQWFAALADAYRKNKDLDLALDILDQWLAKRPNYTSGHIVRGRVLLDRGDGTAARQAFERVLELDAENIIALRSLSEISEGAGDIAGARDWLKRLLEVDPMNEDAEQAIARLGAAPAVQPGAEAAAVAEAPEAPEPVDQLAGFEPTAADETAATPQAAAEPKGFVVERASRPDLEATVPVEGLAVDESPTLGEPAEGELLDMDVGDLERSTDDMLPDVDRAAAPDQPGLVAEGWGEEAAAAEAASAADDVGLTSFDDSLGWDAGERISHSISKEDVEAAEHAHEESLAAAGAFLPGVEGEEVPHVGTEGRDAPPEEEEHGGDLEIAEEEKAIGGDLPLIMPDEVDRAPPPMQGESAVEPEPVVTETMADLYVRQGHLEQARDIYRQLADQRPDDPRLRRRVEELDERLAGAPAASHADPRKRYSAAFTGGLSVREYLQGILGGTAAEGSASSVTGQEGAEPAGGAVGTPMDDAFASEPLGEPTRRASDDVSLASVFGDEPAPPAPSTPSAPGEGKGGKGGGFSFDEFFGGTKPEGSEDQPPEAPHSGPPPSSGPNPPRRDDDFRSWLKGLKT